MQNLTSSSCSVTSISYKGNGISRVSHIVCDIPILGYLGVTLQVFSYFQSYSCLVTLISNKGDKISRLSRLVIEIPFWAILGVFGVLGVFSYLRCKMWRHILAFRPDFLSGRQNFARISRSFGDLTRDRQTTYRRQTRRPKQKALTASVRA